MKTKIGIPETNTGKSASILNTFLAEEFLLLLQTRNAHWNVEGLDFYDKHKFFEMQYEQIDEILDELAERIRAIGQYADAFVINPPELSRLKEQYNGMTDGAGFVRLLLNGHENLIIRMREYIDTFSIELQDAGTADFITGLIVVHEKMAWMLRAQIS